MSSHPTHAAGGPSSPFAGLDLLSSAVVLVDGALAIRYLNAGAENLFAISQRKLLGQPLERLLGSPPGLGAALDNALRTNWSYTGQDISVQRGEAEPLRLDCTVTPVDAASVRLLLEFRPIDAQLRVAREEQLLHQQQANRELIRNLAHEIKNPLGGIRGAAQLLERELDRPQLSEYTQVIIHEADRLQSLVNRLLTPHRIPSYRRTNIHEILVRVKGVVQAEFPAIPIDADFDISLPDIEADPEQLMQAVLNVVRNAAQALTGTTAEPRIVLTTRVARYVTLARRRHRLALSIAIADNGPGIPPAIRDRIFYPLVSGREGGSGLGLTIAQTFVAQHSGTIECDSEPGRTVFRILLPVDLPRAAATVADAP